MSWKGQRRDSQADRETISKQPHGRHVSPSQKVQKLCADTYLAKDATQCIHAVPSKKLDKSFVPLE